MVPVVFFSFFFFIFFFFFPSGLLCSYRVHSHPVVKKNPANQRPQPEQQPTKPIEIKPEPKPEEANGSREHNPLSGRYDSPVSGRYDSPLSGRYDRNVVVQSPAKVTAPNTVCPPKIIRLVLFLFCCCFFFLICVWFHVCYFPLFSRLVLLKLFWILDDAKGRVTAAQDCETESLTQRQTHSTVQGNQQWT
jgi:hypothetical protein